MSETRTAHQHAASMSNSAVKWIKITGWILVATGVLMCLSIIGIPVGLFFIATGFVLIKFLARFMATNYQTGLAAQAEAVEIHEYKLQQARDAQQRGDHTT